MCSGADRTRTASNLESAQVAMSIFRSTGCATAPGVTLAHREGRGSVGILRLMQYRSLPPVPVRPDRAHPHLTRRGHRQVGEPPDDVAVPDSAAAPLRDLLTRPGLSAPALAAAHTWATVVHCGM